MTPLPGKPTRRPLSELFDAALLDLDGTVYLGGHVIDHVSESLDMARSSGMATMFVSNNASRPPAVVAQSLRGMGIEATEEQVLTSPQAAADMLAADHPAGSPVLVVGAPYLHDVIAGVGLVPVQWATDHPVAVVQGHSPDTGWQQLAEACIALRGGADWVACNTDTTLPTDRGLLPGNGAMVAALVAATGLTPRVAGKPARPLLDNAVARAGSERPLVVGDRLDTDIEAACTAGVPSFMPLTGVNSAVDLLVAPPHRRPDYVGLDMRGLVDADHVVGVSDSCRAGAPSGWTVTSVDPDALEPGSEPASSVLRLGWTGDGEPAGPLAALAALLAQAWTASDPSDLQQPTAARVEAADVAAAAALDILRIPDTATLH